MSLTEILVILVVALLVVKPEDIPVLRKNFIKIKRYFRGLQQEIMEALEEPEDFGEMNDYLEKISALGEKYDGDYTKQKVRARYMELLKKRPKHTK